MAPTMGGVAADQLNSADPQILQEKKRGRDKLS